jgi:5-carboxymethyl-2-hydroxymuconate isomerase
MPQLTIEYTDNLTDFDARAALTRANTFLAECGEFGENDIKSRALRLETYRIGTVEGGRAFVSARLALLSGRSVEVKREIARGLLRALKAPVVWPTDLQVQISVEMIDMDRETYTKEILAP